MEFCVFQFVPITSCSVTGHKWEESGSVLVILPNQEFIHTYSSSVSLLQADQSQIFQLLLICHMLQSPNHLNGPSLSTLPYVQVSPVLGSLDKDQENWTWSQQGWAEGRITALNLLKMLFLMQPRKSLAFFVTGAHFLLMRYFQTIAQMWLPFISSIPDAAGWFFFFFSWLHRKYNC